MKKQEILKLIASEPDESLVSDGSRVKTSLEFELKAFKQYYSITSVTSFFVGSSFEVDFEKLELFFQKEKVTCVDNFKLKVV